MVGFEGDAVFVGEGELAVGEEVAGGEFHAVLDGQDVGGDVVVDGADEVVAVHAAGDVLQDGLELADDVLLAQGRSLPSVTTLVISRLATLVWASQAR